MKTCVPQGFPSSLSLTTAVREGHAPPRVSGATAPGSSTAAAGKAPARQQVFDGGSPCSTSATLDPLLHPARCSEMLLSFPCCQLAPGVASLSLQPCPSPLGDSLDCKASQTRHVPRDGHHRLIFRTHTHTHTHTHTPGQGTKVHP